MQREFGDEYRLALKFAIFSSKRLELHRLLGVHSEILDDVELSRLIKLRMKI